MTNKYNILTSILDQIRKEAGKNYNKKYAIDSDELSQIESARSRAFIHLFLKVGFGLENFEEREHYITDGKYDGGIDGYYINKEEKVVYFIQSKFRNNKKNFENKKIKIEEILVMDINRILDGEKKDEQENNYNGKILQLQREISNIEDVARYRYQVILLANLTDKITSTKKAYLTGGYPIEVIDYEKCYTNQIFPVITGTHFNATNINIYLDLSNKNAGSKISYTVNTEYGEVEITVLFIPTIEIAKIFGKYKNSILKYNPRSYLEIAGKKVNESIRDTILKQTTNEFALFNNGITIISDETNLNERIGQKNRAQLNIKNPQIINGGQTAYTLSRIFDETATEKVDAIFENKEVLLKVITFSDAKNDTNDKTYLIEKVSTATNKQTQVIPPDKLSNDANQIILQKKLFDLFGIFYERKRGEFNDGVTQGYISENQILERNHFYRLMLTSKGELGKATKKKAFELLAKDEALVNDEDNLNGFYFTYLVFNKLFPNVSYALGRNKLRYAQSYLFTYLYKPDQVSEYKDEIEKNVNAFKKEWGNLEKKIFSRNDLFHRKKINKETGDLVTKFNESLWHSSKGFVKDVLDYIKDLEKIDSSSNK